MMMTNRDRMAPCSAGSSPLPPVGPPNPRPFHRIPVRPAAVHKISIPTDLIKLIRGPIERFAVEPDGRLFRSEQGICPGVVEAVGRWAQDSAT